MQPPSTSPSSPSAPPSWLAFPACHRLHHALQYCLYFPIITTVLMFSTRLTRS